MAATAFFAADALRVGYGTPTNVGVIPNASATPLHADMATSTQAGATKTSANTPSASPPVRVTRARLGIDAPVQAIELDEHRSLTLPSDVTALGWWQSGGVPGSRTGTVVIAGHVDSVAQGRGALFLLERARPSDVIVLAQSNGTASYRVVARRVYRKNELPRELFRRTGEPQLVLITCGGPFDPSTHHYRDNIVVYAVPDRW